MRVSTLENDPGFAAFAQLERDGRQARVTFNGVEMPACCTADDEAGEVLLATRDDDGFLAVHLACVVLEKRRGAVVITVEPKL